MLSSLKYRLRLLRLQIRTHTRWKDPTTPPPKQNITSSPLGPVLLQSQPPGDSYTGYCHNSFERLRPWQGAQTNAWGGPKVGSVDHLCDHVCEGSARASCGPAPNGISARDFKTPRPRRWRQRGRGRAHGNSDSATYREEDGSSGSDSDEFSPDGVHRGHSKFQRQC